jgi:hypothetical protein
MVITPLESSFKSFMQAQTKQNNTLSKSLRTMMQLLVNCLIKTLLLEMMCMLYMK